jgi:hypothetical protein
MFILLVDGGGNRSIRLVSIMKISTNRSAAVVAEVSKFLLLSGVVLAFVFFQLAVAPVPKG